MWRRGKLAERDERLGAGGRRQALVSSESSKVLSKVSMGIMPLGFPILPLFK